MRFRWPSTTPTVVNIMRGVLARMPEQADPGVERILVPGPPESPDVAVYVYRPSGREQPGAALLYMHGGGFMIGSARMYHATCARFARELGSVVVNVDYRLAPETPFPGPLEDCYAALRWMARNAETLGIDPNRIAVAGESSGGGLAAALAQLAHDRGEIELAFQLLVYPMLDDRTALTHDHEGRGEFLWTPGSNRLAWSAYLGHEPGVSPVSAYAAPARREDLSGLAPAWIGVGTLDLFYPEVKAYASRLTRAGVPCELVDVAGAYHGFDGMRPNASISRTFVKMQAEALRQGLDLSESYG